MGYCTISDVNNLVPQQPFTATTTPTQAQVEGFILDVSTIIDSCLPNLGYVTPVNTTIAPQSLILLRRMVSAGALGIALQVRLTSIAPDASIQNNVWTQRFEAWLGSLKDPKDPFELPDAARTQKRIIKPLGEQQQDPTVNSVDAGGASDPGNYLSSPVFSVGMPF